jgi:hypothetical protein
MNALSRLLRLALPTACAAALAGAAIAQPAENPPAGNPPEAGEAIATAPAARAPEVAPDAAPPSAAATPVAPVAPVTGAEAAEALRPALLALPGVRAMRPLDDTGLLHVLIAAREHIVSLDRLVANLNKADADRAQEYARFQRLIATMIERADPFKPETLRVIVRPTAAIDAFETETALDGAPNLVLRRPFAPGLEEVVAGDTPTSVALMPRARLADLKLGAAQAFDRGRANLATAAQETVWREENGLLVATLDGAYEASLLAVDPLWRAMEARLGGPLAVAAPTRGRLAVGRANDAGDMARLEAIVAEEAGGPGLVAGAVLLRRGGAWVAR